VTWGALDTSDIGTDKATGKQYEMIMQESLAQEYWWTSNIYGIRFVDTKGATVDYSIGPTNNKVFTDSGTNCNYVPAKWFDYFGKLLGAYAGSYTVDEKSGYMIDCAK
jgi:hypothetical protein